MKNAFGVVILCLVVSPIWAFATNQVSTGTQPAYTRPEKAVKPDAQGIAALLAARTVAIVGLDVARREVTIDEKTVTVTVPGGIRPPRRCGQSQDERGRDGARLGSLRGRRIAG
jgi:hypothetical protein